MYIFDICLSTESAWMTKKCPIIATGAMSISYSHIMVSGLAAQILLALVVLGYRQSILHTF